MHGCIEGTREGSEASPAVCDRTARDRGTALRRAISLFFSNGAERLLGLPLVHAAETASVTMPSRDDYGSPLGERGTLLRHHGCCALSPHPPTRRHRRMPYLRFLGLRWRHKFPGYAIDTARARFAEPDAPFEQAK